jgi:hypothetical protein
MQLTRAIRPHFKIENKNLDLSRYINEIETYSSLKNAASSFTVRISFAANNDYVTQYNLMMQYYKLIASQDIVNIGIQRPGLMLGLVDKVRKTKEISGNSYNRGLMISGRCFGKLLITDSVEFSPQIAGNKRATELFGEERLQILGTMFRGFDGKKSQFIFNNPVCAILYILKNIPAIHIDIPYTDITNDGNTDNASITKIGKYFVCDLKSWLGDQVVDTVLSQYSGQIWNYMESCIDKNFYEMFIDTIPVNVPSGTEYRPCLFVRPKPYDRTTDPTQQMTKNLNVRQSTLENLSGNLKKEQEERVKIQKRIAGKNFVIYPDVNRGDFVFENKSVSNGASVVTYVSLAGMDATGIPKDDAEQYKGQRNIGNPSDATNKSMIIPWTWDGEDSFFRTMVTNEPYHVIPDSHIIKGEMGISDDEVINFITHIPRKNILTLTPEAQFGHLFPLMDGSSIQKFGLRSFRSESNLITTEKLTPQNIQSYVKDPIDSKDYFQVSELIQNRERLFCWYRYNPYFEEGTWITRGNQDYRKGDKVYLPDETTKLGNKGIFAYIQSVRNTLRITRDSISYYNTLELIRGDNPVDIEIYRSENNSQVTDRSGKKRIKLGTTYKQYDDSWGTPFNGEEKFDAEGKSQTPGAHNIIKFDTLATDKIKEGAGEIDNKKAEDIEIKEDTNKYREPKKSKTNSESKQNVLKFLEKGIFEIADGKPVSRLDDLKNGYGTPSGGPQTDLNPVIYEYLEMLGGLNLSFPIQIMAIVTGHTYKARGGKVSRHSSGAALDITVKGRPTRGQAGTEEYASKMRILVEVTKKINSKLSSSIRQIICCPYQNLKDADFCMGFSSISDSPSASSHQGDHSDHMHVGW